MKGKLSLLIIAMACAIMPACKDQKKDKEEIPVPDVVKTAFTAKYTGAQDVVWESAHENEEFTYKAKFKLDGKEVKAEFNKEGVLVKEKLD